ncbi:YdcH family protein [Comamonas serinivorans]|uniref:YdcH family protein n=1 Tax=Comamonas serinivorans TaxID=1082851 RepID=UPI002697C5B8
MNSPSTPSKDVDVFPEYRELISRLKAENPRFASQFEKHNVLDQKIINMEKGVEPTSHDAIERLKREKLAIKDELYAMLKSASA